MKLAELDMSKLYSYADYLKWQFEERVELIKGKIFAMSAPNSMHQELSSYIHVKIYNFLNNKECKVFSAPYDVRLPRKSKDDQTITTVVQPDICVVCDKSKRDYKGCLGAPDIVVEILSPSNNTVELKNKYELYEEAGVKEYWVILPQEKAAIVYSLSGERYLASRLMVPGDIIKSSVLDGFCLDLADMFESLD